jgi:hypothetical protein
VGGEGGQFVDPLPVVSSGHVESIGPMDVSVADRLPPVGFVDPELEKARLTVWPLST